MKEEIELLYSFRFLKEGWEGYDQAKPIEERSIVNAENLIEVLSPHFTIIPVPLIDGFVQVEQAEKGGLEFEVEVYPDYYQIYIFGENNSYISVQKEAGEEEKVLAFLLGSKGKN